MADKVYSVQVLVNVVVHAPNSKAALLAGVELAMGLEGLETVRATQATCPADGRTYPWPGKTTA